MTHLETNSRSIHVLVRKKFTLKVKAKTLSDKMIKFEIMAYHFANIIEFM